MDGLSTREDHYKIESKRNRGRCHSRPLHFRTFGQNWILKLQRDSSIYLAFVELFNAQIKGGINWLHSLSLCLLNEDKILEVNTCPLHTWGIPITSLVGPGDSADILHCSLVTIPPV